jgi:glutaredoxin
MTRNLIRAALLLCLAFAMAYVGLRVWRKVESARLDARMVATARPGDIAMLSSTTCSDCAQARQVLEALHVPFNECFIELDAECKARWAALGAFGTPTFVVRDQRVMGFDKKRLVALLDAPR